jgi:hypothetical protein
MIVCRGSAGAAAFGRSIRAGELSRECADG